MAIAPHTLMSGTARFLRLALLVCAAAPATAAMHASDDYMPPFEEPPQQTEPATPNIRWLEQPLQPEMRFDTLAGNIAVPASLAAGHAMHIGRQREDMDLTANDSAILRYNLQDEEPIISEYWWQAIPGLAVAVCLALAMYMRHPIQRKRKYRSTPHEPYGPYAHSREAR